jgi:hypothetical protein
MAAMTGPPTVELLEADIVLHACHRQVAHLPGCGRGTLDRSLFTATGTASGDPALSGDVSARFSVLASEQGGYNEGWLRIREPGTARWKAHGRFFQSEIEEIDQGIFVGEVRDPRSRGGDRLRLFAGMRTLFGETFTAQLGGEVPDGRLPATATGGRCTGPFERFDIDVPATGQSQRTARTGSGLFAW